MRYKKAGSEIKTRSYNSSISRIVLLALSISQFIKSMLDLGGYGLKWNIIFIYNCVFLSE